MAATTDAGIIAQAEFLASVDVAISALSEAAQETATDDAVALIDSILAV